MTGVDPDVARLIERLGLRGLRYRSFGNRPVGVAAIAAPPATATPRPEPAASPAMVAQPGAVGVRLEAGPLTAAPAYPLLAAALDAASARPAAGAADGTLAFLGQRRAGAREGR